MITTAQMMLKALKLQPLGAAALEACTCAFCGVPVSVGDLVSEPSLSSGFMDGRSVQPHGTKALVCGACVRLSPATVLRAVQDVIITEDNIYSIGMGENRAWFLLNPPKPPFAVMHSTSNSQHMWWRAPVTQDSDHWYVQLGLRTITLNRPMAIRAMEAADRVMEAMAPKKIKGTSPFVNLDPWQLGTTTGVIRSDVRRFCEENSYEAELRLFEKLGRGELWALNPLIYKGTKAEKPEPFDLSNRKHHEDQKPLTTET